MVRRSSSSQSTPEKKVDEQLFGDRAFVLWSRPGLVEETLGVELSCCGVHRQDGGSCARSVVGSTHKLSGRVMSEGNCGCTVGRPTVQDSLQAKVSSTWSAAVEGKIWPREIRLGVLD